MYLSTAENADCALRDSIDRLQQQHVQAIRTMQASRQEEKSEKLRLHNEFIEALNTAGKSGSSFIFGDNANGVQIQNNSNYSSQNMDNSKAFDYDSALKLLREIHNYFDIPQFEDTFKENSDAVKAIINDTIRAIENKEKPSLITKSLRLIKELAVGASGSLIASGIIEIISHIIPA